MLAVFFFSAKVSPKWSSWVFNDFRGSGKTKLIRHHDNSFGGGGGCRLFRTASSELVSLDPILSCESYTTGVLTALPLVGKQSCLAGFEERDCNPVCALAKGCVCEVNLKWLLVGFVCVCVRACEGPVCYCQSYHLHQLVFFQMCWRPGCQLESLEENNCEKMPKTATLFWGYRGVSFGGIFRTLLVGID